MNSINTKLPIGLGAIHFIGIGGIGMSGLSLIMKRKGFKVQGSDLAINKNIERLKKEKMRCRLKNQMI